MEKKKYIKPQSVSIAYKPKQMLCTSSTEAVFLSDEEFDEGD